jgi:acetyl-CoA acetyltransferase
MYLSRVAAVNGGLPVETPAFTVNRLCGSRLQAIVFAAQAIKLGDCDVAVAGGAESMSRAHPRRPVQQHLHLPRSRPGRDRRARNPHHRRHDDRGGRRRR